MLSEEYVSVLRNLVGQRVTRVSLDEWAIDILFDEHSSLRTCGLWHLFSNDGEMVDCRRPEESEVAARTEFHLWRIVGSIIESVEPVDAPLPGFTLVASNGWHVSFESDDSGYESWEVRIGKQILIAQRDRLITFGII